MSERVSDKDKGWLKAFKGIVGGAAPVDLAVEAVAPEDAVVGHVQVQSHGVLLRGHHLPVVPLHQVDAADLVAVGEEQVGAFACSQEGGVEVLVLCKGFTVAAQRWTGGE